MVVVRKRTAKREGLAGGGRYTEDQEKRERIARKKRPTTQRSHETSNTTYGGLLNAKATSFTYQASWNYKLWVYVTCLSIANPTATPLNQ